VPSQHSPALWDSIAARYDGLRPDQGLTDPAIRAAWSALIERYLPHPRSAILDVGCGTGSLSLLLASAGHDVTGIDFAPAMIEVARSKSTRAGSTATFDVQDATAPSFSPASFDAVISRQVLWALPDRAIAIRNWARLLKPGCRLILVEGRFASGNGMSRDEIAAAMPSGLSAPELIDLSGDAALWGGPLSDQRLLAVATRLPEDAP
jgi:ubiquinone/menaquinone biosynthesis C-methylase UbiE